MNRDRYEKKFQKYYTGSQELEIARMMLIGNPLKKRKNIKNQFFLSQYAFYFISINNNITKFVFIILFIYCLIYLFSIYCNIVII